MHRAFVVGLFCCWSFPHVYIITVYSQDEGQIKCIFPFTFDIQLSGSCPLGPKEIDRLLVPPGKAYVLLIDHLNTG